MGTDFWEIQDYELENTHGWKEAIVRIEREMLVDPTGRYAYKTGYHDEMEIYNAKTGQYITWYFYADSANDAVKELIENQQAVDMCSFSFCEDGWDQKSEDKTAYDVVEMLLYKHWLIDRIRREKEEGDGRYTLESMEPQLAELQKAEKKV